MIPKIINYCWFGRKELPKSVKKCIASWRKFCPDYEVIQWNENNYDVTKNEYIKDAYRLKKFAFVSDFARLDIIFHNGGIYLDTDVELINTLDSVLSNECFMGLEQPNRVATGLGFGAIKGSNFVKRNLDEYKNEKFTGNNKICVDYTTLALKKLLKENGVTSIKDLKTNEIKIYSQEYFCPFDLQSQETNITKKTISIHHYDATWYSQNHFIYKWQKKLLPLKIKFHQSIDSYFGEGTYNRIKRIFKRGS